MPKRWNPLTSSFEFFKDTTGSTGNTWSFSGSIIASYTLLEDDYQIEITGGDVTITVPTAVDAQGKQYSIKNSGTGVVTVNPDGTEKIDNESTQELTEGDNLVMTSNGTNWIII